MSTPDSQQPVVQGDSKDFLFVPNLERQHVQTMKPIADQFEHSSHRPFGKSSCFKEECLQGEFPTVHAAIDAISARRHKLNPRTHHIEHFQTPFFFAHSPCISSQTKFQTFSLQ
jgi:hypothetical protein